MVFWNQHLSLHSLRFSPFFSVFLPAFRSSRFLFVPPFVAPRFHPLRMRGGDAILSSPKCVSSSERAHGGSRAHSRISFRILRGFWEGLGRTAPTEKQSSTPHSRISFRILWGFWEGSGLGGSGRDKGLRRLACPQGLSHSL